MSAFTIKLIAIIAMALDHVGYYIQPFSNELFWIFRGIGRIAMPLFCFLIAKSYKKTSNPYKYALRLAAAAVISEIPFNLFSSGKLIRIGSLNVMVTLLFGLLSLITIDLFRKNKSIKFFAFVPPLFFIALANILGSDYSIYGVILIILFGIVNSSTTSGRLLAALWVVVFAARNILFFIMKLVLKAIPLPDLLSSKISEPTLSIWGAFQILAIVAVIPILFYNDHPGPRPQNKIARKALQYSFYMFYPIHLMIIWFVFQIVL